MVTIDFAYKHTLQHFWRVDLAILHTLHHLWRVDLAILHTLQHFWRVDLAILDTPDAIRVRAPARMASGRQKSPQMPFVFEHQHEWHLDAQSLRQDGSRWLWGGFGEALGRLWGGFGEALGRLWRGKRSKENRFGEMCSKPQNTQSKNKIYIYKLPINRTTRPHISSSSSNSSINS